MTVLPHHVESGSGLPVVLLHGFGFSCSMWAGQHTTLSASCRLITPDLRGWGRTPLPDDVPGLDAMADDVVALLDHLGLDRVVLGGLSMGGYVAMALLRRHRERVRGVLLADTRATADSEEEKANRHRIADAVERANSVALLHESFVPRLTGPRTKATRPEVPKLVAEWIDAAPSAAVAWSHRAMAARGASLDVLTATDVPALVVVGADDELAPVFEARLMADALPRAELVVLPDVGHMSNVEDPAAFDHAVAAWLSGVH